MAAWGAWQRGRGQDNHKGAVTLKSSTTITAVIHGELPNDSVEQLVSLR